MPSENLLSPAYYNMNVRILPNACRGRPRPYSWYFATLVGADSAPTVGTLRIFIYYKPFRRRALLQKVIERLSLIDNAKISRRTGRRKYVRNRFKSVRNLFGFSYADASEMLYI